MSATPSGLSEAGVGPGASGCAVVSVASLVWRTWSSKGVSRGTLFRKRRALRNQASKFNSAQLNSTRRGAAQRSSPASVDGHKGIRTQGRAPAVQREALASRHPQRVAGRCKRQLEWASAPWWSVILHLMRTHFLGFLRRPPPSVKLPLHISPGRPP